MDSKLTTYQLYHLERIKERVEVQPNECWNWLRHVDEKGYGLYFLTDDSREPLSAFRFTYSLMVGEIRSRYNLHHMCENKRCVHWLHLIPLTRTAHEYVHGLVSKEALIAELSKMQSVERNLNIARIQQYFEFRSVVKL